MIYSTYKCNKITDSTKIHPYLVWRETGKYYLLGNALCKIFAVLFVAPLVDPARNLL